MQPITQLADCARRYLKRDSIGGWIVELHPAGSVALAVGDGVAVHCLQLINDHLHSKPRCRLGLRPARNVDTGIADHLLCPRSL